MIVSSLQLEYFRNYKSLVLDFSPGINVLYGNNGQGKTNVIEAIYMCACARSHRTARDSELIYHNEDNYKINLEYYSSYKNIENTDYLEQIGIHYKLLQTVGKGSQRIKRELTKDNVPLEKLSEFVGNFHAVMFAPEDLQIIKSGPAERRRFIDLLLSQIKPNYFKNLQEYSHILKQRNALLKDYRDKYKEISSLQIAQLEIWDEVFAKKAAEIIIDRFYIIDKMNFYAKKIHNTISNGLEILDLSYETLSTLDMSMEQPVIAELMYNKLSNSREQDIFRGYTSSGPHRDDFDIQFNNISLKTFGSQGQQRTAVLAMKMAELEIIRHVTKETPVLLLDDVMSELDDNRRKQLVNGLQHTQIFVTCTDPEHLDKDWLSTSTEGISYYKVSEGTVKPVL